MSNPITESPFYSSEQQLTRRGAVLAAPQPLTHRRRCRLHHYDLLELRGVPYAGRGPVPGACQRTNLDVEHRGRCCCGLCRLRLETSRLCKLMGRELAWAAMASQQAR
jgi:hypothetical protein